MPHRGSWHSSPPLISPPLLIILLPILALTLLFLAVPPLLSAATHVLRPASVKSGWDSLNILLVVFAILCGVFARRNDDEPSPQSPNDDVVLDQNDAYRRVSLSSEGGGGGGGGYESQQWFGFSEPEERRKVYHADATPTLLQPPATGVTRLRRSSSSYPDLRQLETGDDRYKFRFFDDFEIDKQFRSPAREQFPAVDHRKRWPEDRRQEEEEVRVKEIPVDTFEIREIRPSPPVKSPAPPPPPPPQPPPPSNSARRHSRRMHHKVESSSEITEIDDREFTTIRSPPRAPPTSPPPRPSAKTRSEQKQGKSERRKSKVKREIAMVWASVLSNQRKQKKKQRTKSDIHNHDHDQHYDYVDELTNNATAPPTPPPPPPPLPPPPSVFHSLFRKGLGKSKKIHSVSAPPPPPPPPPLTSSRRWSKRKSQIPPPPAPPPARGNPGKPPLPNKPSNLVDETKNTGNQSPLIPVPPPLPPFKMPAMKFVVRGDFVKIRSNQSSRCSSPEREHIDVEVSQTTATPTVASTTTVTNAVMDHNGDVGGYVFCPSPDVNVKAATFIARLRGEWRLEKLNSIKEKGNGSLPLPRGYTL